MEPAFRYTGVSTANFIMWSYIALQNQKALSAYFKVSRYCLLVLHGSIVEATNLSQETSEMRIFGWPHFAVSNVSRCLRHASCMAWYVETLFSDNVSPVTMFMWGPPEICDNTRKSRKLRHQKPQRSASAECRVNVADVDPAFGRRWSGVSRPQRKEAGRPLLCGRRKNPERYLSY